MYKHGCGFISDGVTGVQFCFNSAVCVCDVSGVLSSVWFCFVSF